MIKLRLGKDQKHRVAVIELRVDERCGNSVRSGVIKGISYSGEVTDGYETRLKN